MSLTPSTPEENFNVVVLYDRPASGQRAMELYAQIDRDLRGECNSSLSLWRVDVATAAECAAEVGAALASAHLILIAVNRNSSPPPAWWGDAAALQPAKDAEGHVLVVLLAVEGEPGPASASWAELVQPSLARRCATIFEWDRADGNGFAHPPMDPGDGLIGAGAHETKFGANYGIG